MSHLLHLVAVDPLLGGEIGLGEVLFVLAKGVITLAAAARGRALHGVVRAQGPRRHVEPPRAEPRRALRHVPDAGRRHQVLLQGGPDPGSGRPQDLHPRPVPVGGPRLPRVLGDPDRWGLQQRERRLDHDRPHEDLAAAGRPADRRPAGAGLLVDRGLRRDAGRLVVGLEVPAARLGPGVGPDGVVRGRPRDVRGHRGDAGRLAVDPRHGAHAGGGGLRHLPAVEPDRHRRGAVRDLPHRRHRRDEPAAVRPRRGRAGAGRRLPHRVLVDPLRACSSWPSS